MQNRDVCAEQIFDLKGFFLTFETKKEVTRGKVRWIRMKVKHDFILLQNVLHYRRLVRWRVWHRPNLLLFFVLESICYVFKENFTLQYLNGGISSSTKMTLYITFFILMILFCNALRFARLCSPNLVFGVIVLAYRNKPQWPSPTHLNNNALRIDLYIS
jgi:hypothetical protein